MKTLYKIQIWMDQWLTKKTWDTYIFISFNNAKAFLKEELKEEWLTKTEIKKIIQEINETLEYQSWQDILPVNFDFSILEDWEMI